jgi:hypothetical protein
MKAHVLRGSKQEISEGVSRIHGEVREAIVFVDDPSDSTGFVDAEEFFAEMGPHMVDVQEVDDSREAIYRRMEGE